MPLPLPRLHEKPDLHLRIERAALAPIRQRVKLQAPHHLAALVFSQVRKDLLKGGAGLGRPVRDAAVGRGEGGEGGGGPERGEEREGDADGGRGEAGGGVEDVRGDGVGGWGGGGIGHAGCGFNGVFQ